MASQCEVLIATDDFGVARSALGIATEEARRIEHKFSRYLQNNVVHEINSSDGKPVTVDDETANLLDFAQQLHELSDGRFDITSGVLREVWVFDTSDNVPNQPTIDSVLPRVGWEKIFWQRPTVRLGRGMDIDLGGIGKEYAVDRIARFIEETTAASAVVNLGGDIAVVNGNAGEPWRVGIESVDDTDRRVPRVVEMRGGGLATSGDSKRYLLKDGVRYGHILNPLTGWPVQNAPRSVTAAANTCTEAGMLATLAMLHGEDAESFLRDQKIRFWCLR